jgi:hypothetical protein
MRQLVPLARRYAFDVLIVIGALESALEIAFNHDPQGPTTTPWFTVPATAGIVLLLLGRHRFPFAAPAAFWVAGAALSFVDGSLVVGPTGLFVAGMAASLLLGNLRDDVQARLGLSIVLGASAIDG